MRTGVVIENANMAEDFDEGSDGEAELLEEGNEGMLLPPAQAKSSVLKYEMNLNVDDHEAKDEDDDDDDDVFSSALVSDPTEGDHLVSEYQDGYSEEDEEYNQDDVNDFHKELMAYTNMHLSQQYASNDDEQQQG